MGQVNPQHLSEIIFWINQAGERGLQRKQLGQNSNTADIEFDYLAGLEDDVFQSCIGVAGGGSTDCRRSAICPARDGAWTLPLTGGRGLP